MTRHLLHEPRHTGGVGQLPGVVSVVELGDNARANLTGGLVDEGQDRDLRPDVLAGLHWLRLDVPLVLVAEAPADPCLVGDNRSPHGLDQPIPLHGLADAVHHEPRRPWAEAVLALDFAGRDPVLGRAHLEDHEYPLADADLGAVERGASQHGELLAALSAPPDPALAHGPGARPAAHAVRRPDEIGSDVGAMGARR